MQNIQPEMTMAQLYYNWLEVAQSIDSKPSNPLNDERMKALEEIEAEMFERPSRTIQELAVKILCHGHLERPSLTKASIEMPWQHLHYAPISILAKAAKRNRLVGAVPFQKPKD